MTHRTTGEESLSGNDTYRWPPAEPATASLARKDNAPGRSSSAARERGGRSAVRRGVRGAVVGSACLLTVHLDAASASSPTPTPASGKTLDAKYFSPSSCVVLAPVRGNRHLTVFLDAGHGGVDPGAIGRTSSGRPVVEAEETLPVELDAASILRRQGFRVVVSRTTNSTVARIVPGSLDGTVMTEAFALHDVGARDVCANDAKADALVGIYFDAGYSPSNAGCLSTYDAVRPFARSSLTLATLIQRDVLATLNAHHWAIPNIGVISDANLGSAVGGDAAAASYGHLLLLGPSDRGYFSTPSKMPGAIVEPLFITDPFEGTIAASGAGQQAIASGIATAVSQYFAPPRAGSR